MRKLASLLLVLVLTATLVGGSFPLLPATSLLSEIQPNSGDPLPPVCPPPTRGVLPTTPLELPCAPL